VYLFVAGVMEVGWALGLKYTEGFTRLWPSVGTVAAMAVSFFFCRSRCARSPSHRLRHLDRHRRGRDGAARMALFGEPRTAARFVCIGLIVAGIAGLKVVLAAREVAPRRRVWRRD
jgi:quaternary ammonium compound-resistance protein SugE